jgi:hypothetical protein
MPDHNQMRKSLEWARHSREQWKTAYDHAVGDHHSEDADFAVKQIAMFDRMIERFERFIAERNDPYNSN